MKQARSLCDVLLKSPIPMERVAWSRALTVDSLLRSISSSCNRSVSGAALVISGTATPGLEAPHPIYELLSAGSSFDLKPFTQLHIISCGESSVCREMMRGVEETGGKKTTYWSEIFKKDEKTYTAPHTHSPFCLLLGHFRRFTRSLIFAAHSGARISESTKMYFLSGVTTVNLSCESLCANILSLHGTCPLITREPGSR